MKPTPFSLTTLVAISCLLAMPIAASAQNNRGGGQRQNPGGGSNAPATASPRGDSNDRGAQPPPSSSQRDNDRDDGRSNRPSRAGARPNDGNRVVGSAVNRPSRQPNRADTIVIPGYYPLGYSPWGYGGFGFGLGFGYDPWGYGFYDPFYGYPRGYVAAPWGQAGIDGALRLKVSPSDAVVYVDGFYAGRVEDYDGRFQRLHLEPGPHRVEIQREGYESLAFDVRILPDRTITYEGKLTKP